MKNTRRAALAAIATAALTAPAQAQSEPRKKVHYRSGKKPAKTPLFSSAVSYGNLLFIAGKGAHFAGDIKAHTKAVLDDVEKELVAAGSSMQKVLKCNVYLNDLKDYAGMNEMILGRFGDEPPVRTTVAPAGGIPGKIGGGPIGRME
jgi:enamine deaminase RidA (YjgF/YER057c/UK114 family)